MGFLKPHPSPYTTLVARYYPALTVLAHAGDFHGIIQGTDSKAYTRPELYALGELLLQQDDSPLQGKGPWSFTPRKGSISATLLYCINSGSIFEAPILKTDAGSCCLDVSTVGSDSVFGRVHRFIFGNCFPTAL